MKSRVNLDQTSSEPLEHKINKDDENYHAGPEDPLVLFRPTFHHSNRISTDPQRVSNAVQFRLRPLQHLPLIAQVAQHGPSALQILVQGLIGRAQKGLFAQDVAFALRIGIRAAVRRRRAAIRAVAVLRVPARAGREIGIAGAEQRVHVGADGGRRGGRGFRVGILRGLRGVRSAAEELGAVLGVLGLFALVFEFGEAGAEGEEVGSEGCDAVGRFRGFFGHELDVDGFLVVVESAGEGIDGREDLALEGWVRVGKGGEGFEVGADGFRLAEGRVVEGALRVEMLVVGIEEYGGGWRYHVGSLLLVVALIASIMKSRSCCLLEE